jgi:peptidyl-prolyl cis-trans isomerase SurA
MACSTLLVFVSRRGLSLCVALLAMLGAACRGTPSSPASPAPAAGADTWAVVDGREIKRDDVEKAFRRAGQSAALSEDEALTAKLTLLNDMIVQDILLARAASLKIDVPAEELDKAYADARAGIAEETFQQELTKRSLTAADMREGLRRELLVQKVIEREVTSKITVTDQEITDFFNANRAQFNFPEDAYRIAQIVVTPVDEQQQTNRTGDDATTPQAAAYKTQMLMDRLKAGAGFADLAADYSEDGETAQRGGDLGFVPLSALNQAPPPLRNAVFNMNAGGVRVVSQGGAHTIVLLVAKEAAGQRDLSVAAVRDGITNTLRGRKEQLLRTAYLTAARSDASVVNHLARRLIETQGKIPSLAPMPPAPPSAPAAPSK